MNNDINTNTPFHFKDIIALLGKRIKFLITFYIIGIIITIIGLLIINIYHKPYYSTNFLIKSEILTARQTALLIKDLRLLEQASQNPEKYYNALNINEKEAAEIKAIETPPIINEDELTLELIKDLKSLEQAAQNPEKYYNALNINEKEAAEIKAIKTPPIIKKDELTLEIILTTYSPTIIPIVKDGIINYLNNNIYVKNSINSEKKHLELFIKDLDIEIEEVKNTKDLLQNRLTDPNSSNFFISVPTFANMHLLLLKAKRLSTLKEINELKGYEILKEPLIPTNSIHPNNIKNFILANIIILVFGVTLTVYLKQN